MTKMIFKNRQFKIIFKKASKKIKRSNTSCITNSSPYRDAIAMRIKQFCKKNRNDRISRTNDSIYYDQSKNDPSSFIIKRKMILNFRKQRKSVQKTLYSKFFGYDDLNKSYLNINCIKTFENSANSTYHNQKHIDMRQCKLKRKSMQDSNLLPKTCDVEFETSRNMKNQNKIIYEVAEAYRTNQSDPMNEITDDEDNYCEHLYPLKY